MNATNTAKAPDGRRVLGSALSALVGWLALNLVLLLWTLIAHGPSAYKLAGVGFIAAYSAGFVFITWVLALMPLYLCVPRTSLLWKWPVCTVCGAVAGGLIMFGFYGPNSSDSFSTVAITLASVVGAVTCLFGSLTAEKFHQR